MNWNVVKAVFRRDLRSSFANPTGYVFILLFVLASAAALMFPKGFFGNNLASLETLNSWFPWIAVVFVAAITMGMWTSERAHGTQELLFTLPAKDSDLLVGKYLAGLGVYTMSLAFMLVLPIGLSFLGTPDWGQVVSTFLGYWLFGGMLIAVAMLGSQLTDNLTVSFILGLLIGAVVGRGDYILAELAPGLGAAWLRNGPTGQFGEFARGMVPASGLLLFGGLTVAFLYLNLALLSRRQWRLGQATGVHRSVRFVSMATGVVALTVIGVYALPRLDTTFERIHSLSAATAKVLAGLDRNRPVLVTAYVSDDVPTELAEQKRVLLNLLDRYDSLGGAAIQHRVVMPEPFSPEAQEAQKNYNIQPRIGGDEFEDGVFLGFAVQCGLEEVVVPFLEPHMSVEYELTRAIRVAANVQRRKVGILRTDVEMKGGFDPMTYTPKQRWQIVEELEQQYKTVDVAPDADYPKDLDALLVAQPSSLPQDQMDRLKDYIRQGNPTLLIEDPEPVTAPGTAQTDPKGGGRQNPMFGQQPGEKGDIGALLNEFGVGESMQEVVWDLSSRNFPLLRFPIQPYLFLGKGCLNPGEPITDGLERLVLLYSGWFRQTDKPGYKVTPLLRSVPSADSAENGTVGKLELFQFAFPGQPKQPNPFARFKPNPGEYVLAARIDGPPAPAPAAEPGKDAKDQKPAGEGRRVKLIVAADLDAFSNTFFEMRRYAAQDLNWRFDNITFLLNCIDTLTGDDSLVELRKRRPKLRQLTTVLEAQREFEKKWQEEREAAEKAAEDQLGAAQKRLNEAIAKISENKDWDEMTKENKIAEATEVENRKLEQARSRIEDEKRGKLAAALHDRNESKRLVQNRYRTLTLLLVVLPPLLMGVWTFVRRRGREGQNVPKSRLVQGGAA